MNKFFEWLKSAYHGASPDKMDPELVELIYSKGFTGYYSNGISAENLVFFTEKYTDKDILTNKDIIRYKGPFLKMKYDSSWIFAIDNKVTLKTDIGKESLIKFLKSYGNV